MDIDKVYRLAGGALKRLWKLYLSKPFRDYNIESRASKAISREKPEPAQWHDATQAAFKEAKKFTDRSFGQYNQFDDKLADRLRSVRVLSKDEEEMEAASQNKQQDKSRYPTDRIGMAMPYVFQKPDYVPPGKLTVYGALDLLLERRNSDKEISVEELATRYQLSPEDLRLLLQYVDVFMAVAKGERRATMGYLDEQLVEDSGTVDTYDVLNDPKKLPPEARLTEENADQLKQIEAKEGGESSQEPKKKKVVSKVIGVKGGS